MKSIRCWLAAPFVLIGAIILGLGVWILNDIQLQNRWWDFFKQGKVTH